MNKIYKLFQNLKKSKKKGFFPFITAGYPNKKTTEEAIDILTKNGADLIELGVPFSDPVADGPVIQEASHIALQKGINLDEIFAIVKKIRSKKNNIPIVLMSYYNPILQYGINKIIEKSKNAGVDGFIIPDLPIEDAKDLGKKFRKNNLYNIFLITLNTSHDRIKKINTYSRGFVYLVSRLGVTGKKITDLDSIKNKINEIRKITKLPIAIGFGVSDPDTAKNISNFGDAVIIGSILVKVLGKNKNQFFNLAKQFRKKI
jgi:tryptophan synthase alpha chain